MIDECPATMPLRSEVRLPHGKYRQEDDQYAMRHDQQKGHCHMTPFGNPWHFLFPAK